MTGSEALCMQPFGISWCITQFNCTFQSLERSCSQPSAKISENMNQSADGNFAFNFMASSGCQLKFALNNNSLLFANCYHWESFSLPWCVLTSKTWFQECETDLSGKAVELCLHVGTGRQWKQHNWGKHFCNCSGLIAKQTERNMLWQLLRLRHR